MSSEKSTNEMIARLSLIPPTRRVWPIFPLIPLIIGLSFGICVDLLAGIHKWEWASLTNTSLTMAFIAIVTALLGLALCLEFVSPTADIDIFIGMLGGFFALFIAGSLASAPYPKIEQVLACYVLIVVMSSPSFLITLWILRRGASMYPALVGIGAGMFSSGLAGFLFLLHCPMVPDGSGIYPEIAAMSTVSYIGSYFGRKVFKW